MFDKIEKGDPRCAYISERASSYSKDGKKLYAQGGSNTSNLQKLVQIARNEVNNNGAQAIAIDRPEECPEIFLTKELVPALSDLKVPIMIAGLQPDTFSRLIEETSVYLIFNMLTLDSDASFIAPLADSTNAGRTKIVISTYSEQIAPQQVSARVERLNNLIDSMSLNFNIPESALYVDAFSVPVFRCRNAVKMLCDYVSTVRKRFPNAHVFTAVNNLLNRSRAGQHRENLESVVLDIVLDSGLSFHMSQRPPTRLIKDLLEDERAFMKAGLLGDSDKLTEYANRYIKDPSKKQEDIGDESYAVVEAECAGKFLRLLIRAEEGRRDERRGSP